MTLPRALFKLFAFPVLHARTSQYQILQCGLNLEAQDISSMKMIGALVGVWLLSLHIQLLQ